MFILEHVFIRNHNKKLILCRHADALPAANYQGDIERKLSEKGRIQCRQGRKWLQQLPDLKLLVMCSPAKRAIETAEILSETFASGAPEIHSELYHCSATGLLKFINGLPETNLSIMLVSHNPGISYFASGLTSQNLFFTTCQLVLLELYADNWGEVSFGAAEVRKVFITE